jgi:hypothetical protein
MSLLVYNIMLDFWQDQSDVATSASYEHGAKIPRNLATHAWYLQLAVQLCHVVDARHDWLHHLFTSLGERRRRKGAGIGRRRCWLRPFVYELIWWRNVASTVLAKTAHHYAGTPHERAPQTNLKTGENWSVLKAMLATSIDPQKALYRARLGS